jgi:ATP-dependent DNA helicase PIF1
MLRKSGFKFFPQIKTHTTMEDDVELSPTQTAALDALVHKGQSGLLTGAGGTGKSFLVREVVSQLEAKGRKVSLTATTGIAAVLIGGVTLMSQFHIVPDDLNGPASINVKRLTANKFFANALKAIQTLIIDEVSMLDVDLFERVDTMLKHAHQSGAPFGGIQVILVGDFFQLPPVAKSKPLRFLFESPLFWETCDSVWELKEVWRQSDPTFCQLLQRIRQGTPTPEDLATLQARVGVSVGTDSITATKLFSRNVNVDVINSTKVGELGGDIHTFNMRIGEHRTRSESSDNIEKLWEGNRDKFKRDVNLPETLTLRVGAQVILSYNLDTASGLCNGSRGVVTSFSEPTSESVPEKHLHRKPAKDGSDRSAYLADCMHPVVEFENGKRLRIPLVRISRTLPDLGEVYVWQVPLRLGWASTIHRMQGQTLSLVDAALDSSVFEVGQAYVALSRARSLEGLCLGAFDPACIVAHPKVREFYLKPFSLQKAEMLMPPPPPAKRAKTAASRAAGGGARAAAGGGEKDSGFEERQTFLIVKDD